jgi:deazaflavin-dependent oxidoreductase (nitroreductase family)
MPLPKALGRFNRSVTNHLIGPVARWLPGFGILIHRGRTTGRSYRTPVNVFRRPGGWQFALTYGQGDWVRNVLHAGGGELITRGSIHRFTDPVVIDDPGHLGMPLPIRMILRATNVDQSMLVDDAQPG